jgi:tetratricopeptide (TPR) repeat protein
LDSLELRAPGGTQLRLRGRLDLTAQGTTFAGRGRIEARDSRTLVSWLTAGSDGDAFAGPFRAESDVRLGGESIALNQMTGTVAGSDIAGRLVIGLSSPTTSLDGDIKLGAVDLPAVIAAAAGMPAKRAGGGLAWPADPFTSGNLGQFRGRIAMASARTMLTPNLVAENLHGVLNFGPSDITLDDFQADIAGGRVSGRLAIERNGDELGARSRVRLTRADMTALLPGDRPPMSGRLNLDAEIEGRGRSPVALIGSLQGKGSFSIEDGRFARLDPSAFDAVIRSVDQGLPIEVTRIRERMEAALARGALSIHGDGSITAAAGQASLTVTKLRAKGADMAISARYDLVAEALDARLTLVGPTGIGAVDIGRPEIAISLQGPIDSPRRTLDIAALSNWLSTRAIAQNAKRLAAISTPLDARPLEPPQTSAAAVRPAVPANSVAVDKPLLPPDEAKTDAIPPNLARPEPAASAVAAVTPEAPANPPPAAKPAADAFAATKPPPNPPPQADPPSTARDTAGVGVPGEANLAPARSPADAGIAELDRAIAANPNDGAALAKRGQTFAARGNYGFAIKDFDEVIRLRPRDAEAFNNRCWARAIIGDLESALRDCNAALQLRPRYADAFDSRGMINLKSGQLGKAIADYDAALRINPKLASSLYGRGIAKIKNDNAAGGNLDIVEAKSIQANIAEEFAGYGIR